MEHHDTMELEMAVVVVVSVTPALLKTAVGAECPAAEVAEEELLKLMLEEGEAPEAEAKSASGQGKKIQ
jgi:hypothetical protein